MWKNYSLPWLIIIYMYTLCTQTRSFYCFMHYRIKLFIAISTSHASFIKIYYFFAFFFYLKHFDIQLDCVCVEIESSWWWGELEKKFYFKLVKQWSLNVIKVLPFFLFNFFSSLLKFLLLFNTKQWKFHPRSLFFAIAMYEHMASHFDKFFYELK